MERSHLPAWPQLGYYYNLLIVMELREVGQEDVLTNLLIKSKGVMEVTSMGNDTKLNYNKVYENPKEYEISYVDALANLEEINNLFKKRIHDKNKDYNFFLDESDNPYLETPISLEQYNEYQQFLEHGEIFCYTTKDTWTKGKDFFFIQRGTVMRIQYIHPDRIYADLQYHDKIGLMKLAELKIILSNPEGEAEL